MPLLGNREEIANMAKLHDHLQNRSRIPQTYIGMAVPRRQVLWDRRNPPMTISIAESRAERGFSSEDMS
jgi:hypothetical protein